MSAFFILYAKKSTAYAKFVKKNQKSPKDFFSAAEFSKQLKNTIIRCASNQQNKLSYFFQGFIWAKNIW